MGTRVPDTGGTPQSSAVAELFVLLRAMLGRSASRAGKAVAALTTAVLLVLFPAVPLAAADVEDRSAGSSSSTEETTEDDAVEETEETTAESDDAWADETAAGSEDDHTAEQRKEASSAANSTLRPSKDRPGIRFFSRSGSAPAPTRRTPCRSTTTVSVLVSRWAVAAPTATRTPPTGSCAPATPTPPSVRATHS